MYFNYKSSAIQTGVADVISKEKKKSMVSKIKNNFEKRED